MRHESMIKRLFPTFSHPQVHWVVARYVPTGEIIACAGWTAPGSPIHNYFRKSAVDFYGWRDQYNCSDEKFEELWSQVDDENWNKHIADNDDVRKSVFGDEPHWYLAPIFTWPEWQGRGVGKLLLDWAIEQADANDPPTPLYLESAPTARPVYMHCGFVPLGKTDFVRRGPAIVRGLEAEEDKDDANVAKINSNAGVGEKVSAKDV
jgi:GNAT superfamily N-acetyltransferase